MKQGTLKLILDRARTEIKCGRNQLTVLSPQVDPYRMDTPAGHRDGEWLAEQLDRAVGGVRRIHWRGLHYALVSTASTLKPNGEIYRNTDEDWTWLVSGPGKAARWLGYIDFDRIIDNRNSPPIIHRKPHVQPVAYTSIGLDIEIPDIDDIEPWAGVANFDGRQPYALSIFGEKASLEDVVLPLAKRFDADLYLPAGEISDSLLYQMARDGAEDGRPMVTFVLADCDPAGHQMAVSIGRKLQALRDLHFPSLEFEVVPVALTVSQVRELGLPSTPLKETERRADRWRDAFGIEQTEIDAIATLQPNLLREIVTDAIKPYIDDTLDRRVTEARRQWQAEAQQAMEEQIDGDTLAALKAEAEIKLGSLRQEIDAINEGLRLACDEHFDLPEIQIPDPELDAEKLARQSIPCFVAVALG
ncbi:MAG: hypothetical protein EA385_17275 [Salinarimonadaceae bacterium]|nr:MAG: hypothetical protein EA385_17275 [Salinarimonadaceae bacterium]